MKPPWLRFTCPRRPQGWKAKSYLGVFPLSSSSHQCWPQGQGGQTPDDVRNNVDFKSRPQTIPFSLSTINYDRVGHLRLSPELNCIVECSISKPAWPNMIFFLTKNAHNMISLQNYKSILPENFTWQLQVRLPCPSCLQLVPAVSSQSPGEGRRSSKYEGSFWYI